MEDTEKMTALKKAYAEIILNTAKEAAARIMVSERKAHRANHDLSCTKDEALRLLLRLKQTMDCQVNEAEVKSVEQQRRIDELEAQLQEAEDIVSSLRAELSDAHTKLEEISKNQWYTQPSVVNRDVYEDENSECQNRPLEAVAASDAYQISFNSNGNSIADNTLEDYGYSGEPDVPSIIIRSKKPNLYRNGCTQRIRACEGNLSRGHLSLAGGPDHPKNVEALREDKQVEKVCLLAPISAEVTCVEKEKPADLEEVKDEDNVVLMDALKSFRKKRKTAARHRQSNASTVKGVSQVTKDTCATLSNSKALLPCSRGRDGSGNEAGSAHLCSTPTASSGVSKIGGAKHVSDFQSDENLSDGREVDVHEDKEVARNLVVTTQPSSSGDIVDTPASQTQLEMKNLSTVNMDVKQLEACDELPSPPSRDRVLKYTFQRKRKRESMLHDESNLVHQENPLRRKKSNKQISNLESKSFSSLAESSPNSRRMAQVAHQLVSLSEKKIWK